MLVGGKSLHGCPALANGPMGDSPESSHRSTSTQVRLVSGPLLFGASEGKGPHLHTCCARTAIPDATSPLTKALQRHQRKRARTTVLPVDQRLSPAFDFELGARVVVGRFAKAGKSFKPVHALTARPRVSPLDRTIGSVIYFLYEQYLSYAIVSPCPHGRARGHVCACASPDHFPVPANYFPVLQNKFPDLFRAGNSSQRADVASEIAAPAGRNRPKWLQNRNHQGKIPCSEGIHARNASCRKAGGRKVHQEWPHHSARSI
jgi:hypothetical protein